MAELHNRWFKGQAVHAELSCLLSPTFGSHAVGSMRWGMAFQGYDGLLESQTPVYVLGRGAVSDNSLLRPSIFNPGNVPMVASATSCTCDPSPGISGSSSLGRDPGTGTSGPDCLKSGIEWVSPVGKGCVLYPCLPEMKVNRT